MMVKDFLYTDDQNSVLCWKLRLLFVYFLYIGVRDNILCILTENVIKSLISESLSTVQYNQQ